MHFYYKNMPNNEKNEIKKPSMSEEEMRSDLQDDLDKVKTARGVVNTEKIISQNTLQEARNKLIRVFFEILDDFDIDPNDLEAINNFLQLLEKKDPDLAELFQSAFEGLTLSKKQAPSEEEGALPMEGMPPTGMMPEGAAPMPEGMPAPPLPARATGMAGTPRPMAPLPAEEGGGANLMKGYNDLARRDMQR